MPDAAVTFSAKTVVQVYNQAHDFVNLGENFNHDSDVSIERNRPANNTQPTLQRAASERICVYLLKLYILPPNPN